MNMNMNRLMVVGVKEESQTEDGKEWWNNILTGGAGIGLFK
jgi:hypothetical protein